MINFDKWNQLRIKHTQKEKVPINLFYYCNGDGNGDLLYNTAREIIDRGIIDLWSHGALERVFECLGRGERWPDDMSHLITPTDQYRMTQGPWLLAYCCAVFLNRIDLIEKYKPNFFMFLPDKWAWRRSLLGKPNMYWLWRRITPYRWMQHFVFIFYGYVDLAYMAIRQKK